MQNKIEIINKKNAVEINIDGTIGVPEEWQFDDPQDRVTTYEKFRNTIELIRQVSAPEVIVNIRSTGGDVNDALLMYEALTSLKSKRKTRCYGYVASAATIVAQAASEGCREVSSNALYLIHQSIVAADGNANDLEAKINLLHKTDEVIANIYAARSGRETGVFATLMSENSGNGRWLSPEETVAEGLADAVIRESEICNYTVINENMENLINQSMVKIKNTYNAILRSLNMTPKNDASETEISEDQIAEINSNLEQAEARERELNEKFEAEHSAHEALREEMQTVQNNANELAAENARLKALSTGTKPIEDPAISNSVTVEGNTKSYAEDAKNFKV